MTVKWFNKKSYTKRGQGTLEYILIIALIVIILFAVIFLLRKQLQNLLNVALQMINNFITDPSTTNPTASLSPLPSGTALVGPTGLHGPPIVV
ncbi:MAG: class III signal peptide-containing protein [Acidobacteriota bacterium]